MKEKKRERQIKPSKSEAFEWISRWKLKHFEKSVKGKSFTLANILRMLYLSKH